MRTIQEQIAHWSDKAVPNADHLAKLQEELNELKDSPHDGLEMADVAIALFVHAHSKNIDLESQILKKLDILEQRTYSEPDENGIARHID